MGCLLAFLGVFRSVATPSSSTSSLSLVADYPCTQLLAQMAQAGERTSVTVASELDGGRTYVFQLRVVNFLNQSSEPMEITVLRDALAIPSITISAPPLLSFRSTDTITLGASAKLASCFTGAANKINFLWSWSSSKLAAGAPTGTNTSGPLVLDTRTSILRDLVVAGSTMTPGVQYTLTVKGCMAVDTSVCGYASTDITLIDQPLRAIISGGDRTTGEDTPFTLDACVSADPDDSIAT